MDSREKWCRSVALSSDLYPSALDQIMEKNLSTALVDRLMHHAHVVVTEGGSVGLQDATSGKGVVPPWEAEETIRSRAFSGGHRHLSRPATPAFSATLSERWGRLFVSFNCLVQADPYPAPAKGERGGVDLGLRVLATMAEDSGAITEVGNAAPLVPRGPKVAGGDDNSPGSYPAHAATGRRKPSSPGWTAGSFTCVGRHATSSQRCRRVPTARWWSKTSISLR